MKKVMITGFNGFIARDLREKLSKLYSVCGVDLNDCDDKSFLFFKGDFTDQDLIEKLFNNFVPDIIIHCAGIAHQKLGSVEEEEYFRINSYATENLAIEASNRNPDVHFIFLSTISVYGEGVFKKEVTEDFPYNPTSYYAKSKVDAEDRLKRANLKKLTILRLSPVYDKEFTLNLDRRVYFPKKLFLMKFGSGNQKMSALSRKNLSEFVLFLINNDYKTNFTFNVADFAPYSFKSIIKVFKKSKYQPDKIVLSIPLFAVWFLTRFSSLFFRKNKEWILACYDKVALDLVFSNEKMLKTGYKPKYNLEKIFLED